MIVKVLNNLTDSAPHSFFSTSANSGGTAIPIKNTNSFSASWAVQIGMTGEEKSEILTLGTAVPSGTVLNTLGTLRFAHPVDTPVYAIKFPQVVFKVSTAGTAGTAVAITDGTVNITPDSQYTQFDHTSGATTYGYKAAYYSSALSETSSDSGWITPAGYNFYSLYQIRERVKNKLRSGSFIKDDETISDWINEWLERMNNTLVDVNQDYNIGTADVAYTSNGLGTITANDFKEIRRIWVTTDSVNYYSTRKMHLTDFMPQDTFAIAHPFYYMQGDSVFGIKPDGPGTARIAYYKTNDPMTDDADELPVPMRGYSKSFVSYALGQAYALDKQKELAATFNASAEGDLERFRVEIAPRSKSGPMFVTLTDATFDDSDNTLWYP